MLRSVVAAVAFAVCASAAMAAEVGGVKLDDKASVGGQELVLNGAGVRTRVILKIYVGSLYVPAKTNNLADLSGEQLVGALVDGLKDNNTEAELAAVKAQTDQLVSIMKAFGEVKEGNVVTLDFVDGATKISLNGQPRGSIAGEPFNQALTKIWLGDKPVQADLKRSMLGG